MPGTGPIGKHSTVRARANKASTRATLHEPDDDEEIEIPELPLRIKKVRTKAGGWRDEKTSWQPLTLEWWRDTWTSPMAAEYHSSDKHGLFRLAVLIDDFWTHPSRETHAEIRLAQKDYGQTPMDRRRLEWTIESSKKAREDGDKRRSRGTQQTAPPAPDPTQDPRLHVV